MPKKYTTIPDWVYPLIDSLSNSELQAGTYITFSSRTDRRSEKQWPYTIDPTMRRVKGSNIPASTFQRFKDRTAIPRQKTIEKLAKYRDRINYARLRASGANTEDARRSYKSKDIEKTIQQYRNAILAIAKEKQTEPRFIAYSTSLSVETKDIEYWRSYAGMDDEDEVDIEDYMWDEIMEGVEYELI